MPRSLSWSRFNPSRSHHLYADELYADEGLIAEATQNADNSITASTSPIISSQSGIKPDNPFGTGVLFIKTKDKNQQETFAYYQHDQLGTPIQAIDKTGKVVWAADYNAFGQATITANDITSNLRLPGQYFDAETALHLHNWNRYYNPAIGGYITSDPIRLDGGINSYAYVGGNPISYIDHTGLMCFDFDKFAGDVAKNRFDLDAILGTLGATLGVSTRPKIPSELSGNWTKKRI